MRTFVAILAFLASAGVAKADLLPANVKTADMASITSVSATGGTIAISGGDTFVKLAGDANSKDLLDRCFKMAVVAKATGGGMTVQHIPPQFGNFGSTPYSCSLK